MGTIKAIKNVKIELETDTKKWIEIAIKRHERHMNGTEPTTGDDGEISQKLMMEEMVYTEKSLDGTAKPSAWYEENIIKFPS